MDILLNTRISIDNSDHIDEDNVNLNGGGSLRREKKLSELSPERCVSQTVEECYPSDEEPREYHYKVCHFRPDDKIVSDANGQEN